jgi:3,4-dihydroxy 2-butanone 4-phosphate synthase/GTP cyclohydrolase II
MVRRHYAYQFSKPNTTSYVKFHSIKKDHQILTDYKKLQSYIKSIEFIKKNGGIVVFLDRKDYNSKQTKDYGIGAQILKYLGVKKIKLLALNKNHDFVGLGGFGLDIVDTIL